MTEEIDSPLIQQVKRLRAAQYAREEAELRRLVDAYRAIDRDVRKDAELLARDILEKYSARGIPTDDQIYRMKRYRELMDAVAREMRDYETFMRVEVRTQSRLEIELGEQAARNLAQIAARGVGLDVEFRALNVEVIDQLIGFLDPRGPLYRRLGQLGPWTAEQVSEHILSSVAKGLNPRTTAAQLIARMAGAVTDGLGMGLTDSLRMMRTVQLYSYREANRASYLANRDVVTGWIWWAELDGFTCPSCIAMHGTEHPLTQELDDHHNGRCTMLPQVIGATNDVVPGAQWFESLNEEQQRAILGPGRFEAWKDRKFIIADLPTQRDDEVYGKMRTAKTLKELVGET